MLSMASSRGVRRVTIAAGALLLLAGSLVGAVSVVEAGGLAAAMARVAVGQIALVRGPGVEGHSEGAWTTVALDAIETSASREISLQLALECGLYTPAPPERDGAGRVDADVRVRVLVDGRPAEPAQAVFTRRSQPLSPALQRLLERALTLDSRSGAVVIDAGRLDPADVALLQGTMRASSCGFVLSDVAPGTHIVEVQARIELGAAAQAGQAVAKATLGRGSLTIEGARRIRGQDPKF